MLAFSSGNHAQGIALAAQRHAIPAVILMPADAPAVKIDNTRAYGAEVILYDRATEDRDAIGAALVASRGLALIKPYDDEEDIELTLLRRGNRGISVCMHGYQCHLGGKPFWGGGHCSHGIHF